MGNEFNENELSIMMLQNTSHSINKIANYFEKYKDQYTIDEVIIFLREIADEQAAQVKTIQLIEQLNINRQ